MNDKAGLTYTTYLQLDSILNAQQLKSASIGQPAHDEMLFIIIHQVYELWFKQIIHDLESLQQMFEDNYVDERNIGVIVHRMHRIIEIQDLLLKQVSILETMTPLDFLDFRHVLGASSGFQSFQFRKLETMLGLKEADRVSYGKRFDEDFTPEQLKDLHEVAARPSLHDLISSWLERIPFINLNGFNFLSAYGDAVKQMLNREQEIIENYPDVSEAERNNRLRMLKDSESHFEHFLDKKKYNELLLKKERRLSHEATLAALFINLYRDEPILQLPFELLQSLVTLDNNIASWRHRHSLMVLRMLGKKMGTGGSSGFDYLRETVDRHRVFTDLFHLSILLIPRSMLPALPDSLKQDLGFYYSAGRSETCTSH